jgi:hypothetical protein
MLVLLSLRDAEIETKNVIMSLIMTQDKSPSPDQEAGDITNDPSLNKEAINELVDQYEKSANSGEPTELNAPKEKELGEVERALEDSVMGIEDAS